MWVNCIHDWQTWTGLFCYYGFCSCICKICKSAMHCAWFVASLLISWLDVIKPKYTVQVFEYNNIQFKGLFTLGTKVDWMHVESALAFSHLMRIESESGLKPDQIHLCSNHVQMWFEVNWMRIGYTRPHPPTYKISSAISSSASV